MTQNAVKTAKQKELKVKCVVEKVVKLVVKTSGSHPSSMERKVHFIYILYVGVEGQRGCVVRRCGSNQQLTDEQHVVRAFNAYFSCKQDIDAYVCVSIKQHLQASQACATERAAVACLIICILCCNT